MKIFPAVRIIAFAIAGVLVVAGAFFLIKAHRIRKEFHRKSEARPFDFVVDLAKPGEFTAEFHHTWQTPHGQLISLHVPSSFSSKGLPSTLLSPLNFKWRIEDSEGAVVVDSNSSGKAVWDGRSYGESIPLSRFHAIELGTYRFTFTVLSGAPSLAGVEQRLVCQYRPVGLELLATFIGTVIGIAALVVAGIIALAVRYVGASPRRRTPRPTA